MPAPPPAPDLGAQWAWPLALVAAALGVLLLIWGEKYHRAALALVGAGAGVLLGPEIASWVGMGPLAGQIAAPLVLAVLAVIGAHYVWAIVAAALALGGGGWALACHFAQTQPPQATTAPAAGLDSWARAAWAHAMSGMSDAWQGDALVVVLVLFPAGAVPLIVGLFKPRLATVAMTALLGAAGVVFGVLLASAQITASCWSAAMAQWTILALAVAALTTLGVICQYRRLLAGQREDDDEDDLCDQDDEPPDKGRKQDKAGKKRKTK